MPDDRTPQDSLSDLALLHLGFLMRAQGTTETVLVKDDCPRCQEIRKVLGKVLGAA